MLLRFSTSTFLRKLLSCRVFKPRACCSTWSAIFKLAPEFHHREWNLDVLETLFKQLEVLIFFLSLCMMTIVAIVVMFITIILLHREIYLRPCVLNRAQRGLSKWDVSSRLRSTNHANSSTGAYLVLFSICSIGVASRHLGLHLSTRGIRWPVSQWIFLPMDKSQFSLEVNMARITATLKLLKTTTCTLGRLHATKDTFLHNIFCSKKVYFSEKQFFFGKFIRLKVHGNLN